MIIDDSENFLDFLELILKKKGHKVLKVHDGKEGLDIFLTNTDINVIITDFVMPKMNGLELIQEIRKFNKLIPILIISGHNEENLFNPDLLNSKTMFLKKPFGVEKLMNKLQMLNI